MVILCTELKKGTRSLRFCFAPKDIILNDGTVYDSSYALEFPFIEHYQDMRVGKMQCRLRDTPELKPFYQGADIQIFLYEPETGTLKTEAYFTGHIIRSTIEGGSVILFCECLKQTLYRTIGRRFSHECGFGWGDARCGIDISLYAKTILVTDKAFDGKISFDVVGGAEWQTASKPFLKGADNVERPVLFLDINNFFLYLEDNGSVNIGDEVTLYAGCDKIFSTCDVQYSNTDYYGGFLFG